MPLTSQRTLLLQEEQEKEEEEDSMMSKQKSEGQLSNFPLINLPLQLSRSSCSRNQGGAVVGIRFFLTILSFFLFVLHVNGHSWHSPSLQAANPPSSSSASSNLRYPIKFQSESTNTDSVEGLPVRGFHVQDHLFQDVQGIISVFTTSNSSVNFTHLTIDPVSGRVYVGATNWIFQLTSNLNSESSVRTGPVLDSPTCSPSDCSGLSGLNGQGDTSSSSSSSIDRSDLKMTKNVNKVLVIDPSSRMLIVCGSVHQGSCRRHSLSDVRQAEPLIGVPVAANDENSSTVAFVGKANYGGSSHGSSSASSNYGSSSSSSGHFNIRGGGQQPPGHNVLFTAVTNTRLGPYRDVVPAISSRSLESPALFSIIEDSFTDSARVDISYHLRDYFIVKYVTGFQSNNFVYFATVQPKSPFRALEEWGSVSRLARVCSSDAGYHSYTEMTIQCRGPSTYGSDDEDGYVDYNLLQSASVLKAGNKLALNLGIREGSEVFIGTFSVGRDHSSSPDGSRSAVCLFPMEEIERHFMANIHLCYNGSVSSRNMDYIAGSVNECPEPRKYGNVGNFCNEAMKLNGSLPLSTLPIITYNDTTLTAITATNMVENGHSIAILGTSDGRVKKILISNGIEEGGKEMEQVTVDGGHPILQDIHLDHSKNFIFAASPYKVVKIRLDDIQGTSRHHHRNHHKHHGNTGTSSSHHNNNNGPFNTRVQGEAGVVPRSGPGVSNNPIEDNQSDNNHPRREDNPLTPSVNERRKPSVVVPSGQRNTIKNQDINDEDDDDGDDQMVNHFNDSPGQESLLKSHNHILVAVGLGFFLVLVLVSTTALITRKNSCRSPSFRSRTPGNGPMPPLPLVKPLPLIPMPGMTLDHPDSEHKGDNDQFTYSDNNVYCEPTTVMVPSSNKMNGTNGSIGYHHQVTRVDTSATSNHHHHHSNYSNNGNNGGPPPLYPPFITFNMIASHRDKSIPFIQTMGRRSGGQGGGGMMNNSSQWTRPNVIPNSPSGTMNPLSALIDNPMISGDHHHKSSSSSNSSSSIPPPPLTGSFQVPKFTSSHHNSSSSPLSGSSSSNNSKSNGSSSAYSYSTGCFQSSNSGRDRFV